MNKRKDIFQLLTDNDIDEILMLAECNMNKTRAAKRLYCHRNTLVYHMTSLYKRTGLNPQSFRDLTELVCIVESHVNLK